MKNSLIRISGLLGIGFTSILNLSACKITDSTLSGNLNDPSNSSSPLTISPSNETIVMTESLEFSASGGRPPYVYYVVSGHGSIETDTGLFTAAQAIGSTTVQVADAIGQTATAVIEVVWAGLDSIDNLSSSSLRLNWLPVTGAINYHIYNTTNGSSVFLQTVGGGVTSYPVTGLDPLKTYSFRVQVVTPDGTDKNTHDVSATTPSIVATHQGWEHIQSEGARTPVAQATGLSSNAAYIYLKWSAMTLSSGSIDSYNVYRSTSSGDQDFQAPIATGVSPAAREYTDTTITEGVTYFYVVRPVSGSESLPTSQVDSEIKVMAPPSNMVLVHRWIANKEACGLMGKTIDRDNHYRCEYTGIGGDGSHYDMGYSYFIDAVEMGCNYTDGNVCNDGGLNPCLGTSDPGGVVTAATDTVYYNRQNGRCWINTNGLTGWKQADDASLSAAQRRIIASNKPGLPPLVNTSQSRFWDICQSFSEPGFSENKRLLKRKESIAASSWEADLSDSDINSLENDGTSLVVTGKCNTNSGSGLSFDNNAVPGDLETLPWLLSTNNEALRTGSNATQNCTSRFGAQDLVGNIWEWNSDQILDGVGVTSSLDLSNSDWTSWDASTLSTERFVNLPSPGGYFIPALGLPTDSSTDGVVLNTSWSGIHNDYFYINTSGLRAAFSGSRWDGGSAAGRFVLNIGGIYASNGVGSRCALPEEP